MDWNNASLDKPPVNGKVVLISVNGIYFLSLYDAKKDVFVANEGKGPNFDPKRQQIYWIEFEGPDVPEN